MLSVLREMPNGVRIVLAFGLALLAGVGLSLPLVIDQAIEAPISPLGLLWMLLLAYLIFTLTLILQRKQAAWLLSLGLASLSIPLTLILYTGAAFLGAAVGIGLAIMLFLAVRSPRTRAWFSEP